MCQWVGLAHSLVGCQVYLVSTGSWPTDGWGWVSRQLAVGCEGAQGNASTTGGWVQVPKQMVVGLGVTRSGDSLRLADRSPMHIDWSVCVGVCVCVCDSL